MATSRRTEQRNKLPTPEAKVCGGRILAFFSCTFQSGERWNYTNNFNRLERIALIDRSVEHYLNPGITER